MFFYSNAYPFWVNINLNLWGVNVLWDNNREEWIIRILKFFKAESKLAFIALPNLAIFSKHWTFLFLHVFLWIFLSLLSFFIIIHFLIHFSSYLFWIRSFHMLLLLFTHMLLHLFSLYLFSLSLLYDKFFFFNSNKQCSL